MLRRWVKASRIFCRCVGNNLFLLPLRTNWAFASMKSVALSLLDFFSTTMQVAIVVPKNRSGGN